MRRLLDMKQLINPAAFNKSLAIAFNTNFDVESSIRRVKKIIANLPPDKLYYTNRKGWISFYKRVDGKQKCLPKASNELYLLARRKYLLLQLEILELTGKRDGGGQALREKLILEIQQLIDVFASGNLDVARIVMTPSQYKWFAGPFRKKSLKQDIAYQTVGGTYVRSKSERDILNTAESLAVPAHYEEETIINVHGLVESLYDSLVDSGVLKGNLFYYRGHACCWRVPKELEWMNSPGSIWATYNYKTGKLTIFNDFKIMLANNDLICWEHHGICSDFTYRSNAGERVMVMKYTRSVPSGGLIETFEHDVDSPDKIIGILKKEVLPKLWF